MIRSTMAASMSRALMVRSAMPVALGGATALHGARVASTSAPTSEEIKKMRPMSPHLTIYQPQMTSVMSGSHRITGVAIAGVFYGTGLLAAIGCGSADLVACAAALPAPVLFLGKAAVAAPFAYHSCNGVRHLLWDTGRALTIKGVYQTGYATLGASALATLGLLMW